MSKFQTPMLLKLDMKRSSPHLLGNKYYKQLRNPIDTAIFKGFEAKSTVK